MGAPPKADRDPSVTPTSELTDPGEQPTPGDPTADQRRRFNDLFVTVQAELRSVAHRLLDRNRRLDDVDTTILIHDMYVRLARSSASAWQSPLELQRAAATILRNLLTDAARERRSGKRGGTVETGPLDAVVRHYEGQGPDGAVRTDLLDLDIALKALEKDDGQAAKMLELHYYLGVNVAEIANVFDLSVRRVQGILESARRFLRHHMAPPDRSPGGQSAPEAPDAVG